MAEAPAAAPANTKDTLLKKLENIKALITKTFDEKEPRGNDHSAVAFESIIQSMHIVSVQRLEFSRFIFFVVFYIDEEKLAANPGAMAIPDRSYRCFARPSPKADTFRRRAARYRL